jgi:hypothetical protein
MRTTFVLALFAGVLAHAQTTTTLLGTVTDKSGGVVPGAQVSAINTGTNLVRTTQTTPQGEYRIDFLPIGEYTVEVSSAGFKKFVQSGVVLQINVTARVNAQLDVGQISDSVEVTAAAPAVNTENAQIGRTVDNREITTLPIVGRNVYSLLTLTPGVSSSSNSITLGFPEQRTMINGGVDGGAGSVNYYLDGGNNMTGLRNTGNVAPNPDAVEEFRVITNNYSAEYGRFAGGVVNVITRSGTNTFHGSLFEFLRNDALNAHDWGALTMAPLRRNQFGGTLGGPIRRDKTFFFGTYSGLRQNIEQFLNGAVVPTPLERSGNFSASKTQPKDPLSGNALFPGGIIPSTRFDPVAMNILNKYIPASNLPNSLWQGYIPNPLNSDEVLAKVDHALNDSQRLSGSYYETSGRQSYQAGGNLPWSAQNYNWRQQNVNASDTWTLGGSTVNQFWFTYGRNFAGRVNLPGTSLGDLGSTFQPQGTQSLPQITVTGFFTLAESIAGPVAGTNFYSVRDMLSYTRGRHTFKFGGELALDKDIQQTLLNNYGVFSFSGSKTGNAFADFLTGLPVTMNQDAPITAMDNFWTTALYAQDDFRVHPRLTLNLGLRWDVQTAPTDPFNREATFVQGVQSQVLKGSNVPTGLLVVGDPGVKRGIVATPLGHVSPRIGVAWDPFGTGKTSIRAGAGLFYGSVSGNEWNSTSNYQPFAVREQFNNVQSLSNPYGLLPGGVNPFPYSYNPASPQFILPAAIYGIAPNFRWPYTYQLNFTVQREVAKGWTLSAGYVGSLSHLLPFAMDLNYPYYTATATTGNVNNRRPIEPGVLSNIFAVQSSMNTSYHSLQITMEKRVSQRFTLKAFYVYSKDLESAQLDNNTVNGGAEDYRNLALDRGRSDNDRRHVAVGSLVWNLDYFGKWNRAARSILNGWQFSAIVTLQSGLPFNVTSGSDINLDGNNNDRPMLLGNPFLDPNRSRSAVTAAWFNTAAFGAPAKGVDGNTARNLMDRPGSKNVDAGLFRDFHFTERVTLQARGEFTNAFNLVNLNAPNGTLTSQQFGKITGAGSMRQVQVGLRMTF